eukprot:TRINITY_DN32645_c0_g5_i2.p1 TRINITY_DN32645_c0_g5~~TRINITY_DN32645_c0_g5_i2.p1  ORF type:complete len:455 (+),score=54.99 TRINITY_DN32645_c0_g5_i2:168-1532(+)
MMPEAVTVGSSTSPPGRDSQAHWLSGAPCPEAVRVAELQLDDSALAGDIVVEVRSGVAQPRSCEEPGPLLTSPEVQSTQHQDLGKDRTPGYNKVAGPAKQSASPMKRRSQAARVLALDLALCLIALPAFWYSLEALGDFGTLVAWLGVASLSGCLWRVVRGRRTVGILPATSVHVKVSKRELHIVSTMHVSSRSARDVRQVIEQVKPEMVFLEIDEQTMESLEEEEAKETSLRLAASDKDAAGATTEEGIQPAVVDGGRLPLWAWLWYNLPWLVSGVGCLYCIVEAFSVRTGREFTEAARVSRNMGLPCLCIDADDDNFCSRVKWAVLPTPRNLLTALRDALAIPRACLRLLYPSTSKLDVIGCVLVHFASLSCRALCAMTLAVGLMSSLAMCALYLVGMVSASSATESGLAEDSSSEWIMVGVRCAISLPSLKRSSLIFSWHPNADLRPYDNS